MTSVAIFSYYVARYGGAKSLTPKFSRVRRARNSQPRQNVAPHVGCNATLGEAAAAQGFARGAPERLRVLGSLCCASEAAPAAVPLGNDGAHAAAIQAQIGYRGDADPAQQ